MKQLFESTAIEQQGKVTLLEAKVTQLESQGELNVNPILLSSIQSFTVGKTLFVFYDRLN
jgi:hypothetical protein